MEALKLIPVLFSISTFNCTVDYFNELKLGDNYKPLNDVVDICAVVRSDNRNDEDLKKNVHHYIDKCEQNITKDDCKSTIDELLKSFDDVVKETAREMPVDEREMILRNENCILEKFHTYKVYQNYFKFFTKPENFLLFWTSSSVLKTNMESPIRLGRIICMGDEIYSMKFDENKHHIKNLSQIELCNIQYLIDEGFVDGKLSEQPQSCNVDTEFLNTKHLIRNYPFNDFFILTRNEIKKCFVAKVEQHKLFPQLIGIEFSYALQSKQFNVDETKKKFIRLMKSMDVLALECYTQIKFD